MSADIVPEEKLLKLIRGQKKQPTSAPMGAGFSLPLSFAIRPAWLSINKIILLLFILSIGYLLFNLAYQAFGLNNIELLRIKNSKFIDSSVEPKLEIKPYEFYADKVKNWQVFGMTSGMETSGVRNTAPSDLVKDINLVGIIDDNQVVIEDKKAGKTYYLAPGQFIGEIQVEKILDRKVILNYKGERFELYL